MNIRQPWVDHHEWTDSLADWAESNPVTRRVHHAHRALPLPAERQWVAPQGRIEQGWPARRCSSEPTVIDRLPEAYDNEDQSESADGVLLWFFVAVMLAIACGYCVAKYLAAAYV